MQIESEGAVTEVIRTYEPEAARIEAYDGGARIIHESPPLDLATQAVASAAAIAHRITPKENR